jgi:hypothetical protein
MSRCRLFGLLLLAGCSTHPICDVKDYFRPGKIGPNKVQPYGGVCIPQGPITGPGPSLPSVPAINVPVVPPPAPLPPPTGIVPPAVPPAPSIFPGR